MQEVQDMLNRMVTLATQSANGTYDNEVDRANLQKEVDQLKSEINRIADSANFNGIKLLDGSLDSDGRRATTETIYAGMKISNNQFGIAPGFAANKSAGQDGGSNDKNGIVLTGVNLATAGGVGEATASDKSVRYHKDAVEGGKTAFTIDLDGSNYSTATSGTKISGLIFGLKSGQDLGAVANSDEQLLGNVLFTDKDCTKRVTYDVTADNNGITSENIATSVMNAIEKNGGKVYIKAGNTANQTAIEYNVTREGDKLRFEMTDDGYVAAAKAADAHKNDPDNFFQGNFNFAVNYKTQNTTGGKNDVIKTDDTAEAVVNELGFTNAVNDWQHASTSVINEGTTPAGTIYAEALIRFDSTNPNTATTTGKNDVNTFFKDGAGVKLGDDYYIFARSDEVLNGEYANNVHVVDLRDLSDLGTTEAKKDDHLRLALDRLSVAAKDNEMFDVQVAKDGNALVLTELSTYEGNANLTEKDRGLENQIQAFESATSKTTVQKEAGEALTLQIGDTSEEFNQLKVNIGDIHADALGVDKVSVATQEGAQAAIDTIKSAINKVSSIRGTLGATQNRLEHTANNLSVMAENIQDAESSIRDTDIAAEMMAYTKNNILVQSAQAMLAQANQIPQGVLQLLG